MIIPVTGHPAHQVVSCEAKIIIMIITTITKASGCSPGMEGAGTGIAAHDLAKASAVHAEVRVAPHSLLGSGSLFDLLDWLAARGF
jgi:hypothetical protein